MAKFLLLGLLGIGAVVLILLILFVSTYNRLISLSQQTDSQWAQVQNVYQRRADLVPNLVATVSGAANFEKSTLVEITNARASVGKVSLDTKNAPDDPAKLAEFEKAQGQLSSALSRLLVVVERYPELKANSNFVMLQTQLEGTENRISVERGRFNDVVQNYNSAIKSLPGVFFASSMGLKEKPYFVATPGAEKPPQVQFNFGPAPATPAAPPAPAPAK